MFLDHDWFTLETASTLIANHSGRLHAALPVETPAAAAEAAEPVQPQQTGKHKQTKQQRQREQSPPIPPPVPLSAVETAAAALSGTHVLRLFVMLPRMVQSLWVSWVSGDSQKFRLGCLSPTILVYLVTCNWLLNWATGVFRSSYRF